MKQEIIRFAKKHGIECIGFCRTVFENEFELILKERRLAGFLSEFVQQNEKIRTDFASFKQNARSVIMIALPYCTKSSLAMDDKLPRLSKSSMGLDYHIVLKNRLDILADFLYNNYGAECRCFCDTGPLPDRELARMSGIGFYGKNANIITEKYGSFVFLGGIVTDLELESDEPIVDSCGSCDVCIRACPAQAIESPYVVNPHKCLSYLTQKKMILTYEEMEQMGNRVYGCDRCQDVCPKNKEKNLSEVKEFIPEPWNARIDVEHLLNMSNRDFKGTFAKTSAGWRGKKNLQRNLIIALGNSGDLENLSLLMPLIDGELGYYVKYAVDKLKRT